MGNNNTRKECESCGIIHSSTAVLEIHHHGELGGRFLCVHCFEGYTENNNYLTSEIKTNIKTKISKCAYCSHKNKNELSYHNFKIHWLGKYNNMIMCEKCLFNKSRRKFIKN